MQTGTVETRDLRLGFLSAGDPGKPPLVLLHGWPQCKEVYDQVIDPLGEDHFVIALDLPAVGESHGVPPSAEKTALANIVLSAAEHLGAQSLLVAGIDVGGMIAFSAARDHGERIIGAVVMNTVVPGIDPWAEVLADARIWHFAFHAIPGLPETMVQGRQRAYFDYFFNALAGDPEAVTQDCRIRFAEAFARPEALKAGFDWYRALEADAKHNAQPARIGMPVLYLRGDADGGSPDHYLPGLRQAGVRHVTGAALAGSGEFAPLEAPQAFVEALLRFESSLGA